MFPIGQDAYTWLSSITSPSDMDLGLTTTEWQAAAEMEAVLNVTCSACFLSQYEMCYAYTGGYSVCLKQLQIYALRSGFLSVILLLQTSEAK